MAEAETAGRLAPDLERLAAEAAADPADGAARLRLAWGLFGAGELERARTAFEDGVRDFPDEVDLVYGLGLTAKRLGRSGPAAEAFLRAAELAEHIPDPGRSEILHRLAMGHHNQAVGGRWGLKREVWGGD